MKEGERARERERERDISTLLKVISHTVHICVHGLLPLVGKDTREANFRTTCDYTSNLRQSLNIMPETPSEE